MISTKIYVIFLFLMELMRVFNLIYRNSNIIKVIIISVL